MTESEARQWGLDPTVGPDFHPCFGCGAAIADTPGNAYCDKCVAEQTKAHRAEVEAFDAFHKYADAVAHKHTK